jgi:hypothetical protein
MAVITLTAVNLVLNVIAPGTIQGQIMTTQDRGLLLVRTLILVVLLTAVEDQTICFDTTHIFIYHFLYIILLSLKVSVL